MPEYELSPGAESDLVEIATYTIRTWGETQASRYGSTLERHFRALARGDVVTRVPLPHRPELRSSRCEHHYVFTMHRTGASVLVLAVLHKNMDLMTRLSKRLDGSPD